MLARTFRYEVSKRVMKDYDYSALVTATSCDDQAETIFMRLLRGSRLRRQLSVLRSVFLHLTKDQLPVLF